MPDPAANATLFEVKSRLADTREMRQEGCSEAQITHYLRRSYLGICEYLDGKHSAVSLQVWQGV